jgi:hypothetical protein
MGGNRHFRIKEIKVGGSSNGFSSFRKLTLSRRVEPDLGRVKRLQIDAQKFRPIRQRPAPAVQLQLGADQKGCSTVTEPEHASTRPSILSGQGIEPRAHLSPVLSLQGLASASVKGDQLAPHLGPARKALYGLR